MIRLVADDSTQSPINDLDLSGLVHGRLIRFTDRTAEMVTNGITRLSGLTGPDDRTAEPDTAPLLPLLWQPVAAVQESETDRTRPESRQERRD